MNLRHNDQIPNRGPDLALYPGRTRTTVFAALACLLLGLTGFLASTARAGQPERTDVMLLIDTTGSMQPTLDEAAARTEEVISKLRTQIPDVEFGVSEVRDAGGSSFDPKEPTDVPWRLDVPITANQETVVASIRALHAQGGGDSPEAYGRALWEAANNPTVGWRPNAAHLVVLVADSVPHDNDLNEGIPESDWVRPTPVNTGTELPEPYGVLGTTITPQTDLDWQAVLQQVADAGIQLEVITYGIEGTLAYWENWAARTDGEAVVGDHGELAEKLLEVIKKGTARACNSVHGTTGRRLLASLKCEGALAPLAAVCGATVPVSKRLEALSARGIGSGHGPLVRLLRAARRAHFLHRAPKGFAAPDQIVRRMERARTAIALIMLLPHFSKSVRGRDFERIAGNLAEAQGVKSCAAGLLRAVS